MLQLTSGGLATRGDANRYIVHQGRRYAHILNPLTCRPVVDAPHSVTVAAPTCITAGALATLAILRGPDAEAFLADEGVRAWCIR